MNFSTTRSKFSMKVVFSCNFLATFRDVPLINFATWSSLTCAVVKLIETFSKCDVNFLSCAFNRSYLLPKLESITFDGSQTSATDLAKKLLIPQIVSSFNGKQMRSVNTAGALFLQLCTVSLKVFWHLLSPWSTIFSQRFLSFCL